MFSYRLPHVDHETLDFILVMMGLVSFFAALTGVCGLVGDLSRF